MIYWYLTAYLLIAGGLVWVLKKLWSKRKQRPAARPAAPGGACSQAVEISRERMAYLSGKIAYLQQKVGDPGPAFTVNSELRNRINQKPGGEANLNLLLLEILRHMRLSPIGVRLFVVHSVFDSGQGGGRAGTYQHASVEREIELILKKDYGFRHIAAILCHECAHYYSDSKGFALPDTDENEDLTDILPIYLGFGQVMLDGYAHDALGYLKHHEMEYVERTVSGLRRKCEAEALIREQERKARERRESQRRARRGAVQHEIDAALEKLSTAEELYGYLLGYAGAARSNGFVGAGESWTQLQEIFLAIEQQEVPQELGRARLALERLEDPELIRQEVVKADSLSTRICAWNALLGRLA